MDNKRNPTILRGSLQKDTPIPRMMALRADRVESNRVRKCLGSERKATQPPGTAFFPKKAVLQVCRFSYAESHLDAILLHMLTRLKTSPPPKLCCHRTKNDPHTPGPYPFKPPSVCLRMRHRCWPGELQVVFFQSWKGEV